MNRYQHQTETKVGHRERRIYLAMRVDVLMKLPLEIAMPPDLPVPRQGWQENPPALPWTVSPTIEIVPRACFTCT